MSSNGIRSIEQLRSMKRLESGWNNDVNYSTEKKRLQQMSTDIKSFILRSMSDPLEAQKIVENEEKKRRGDMDSFSKISSTLGFVHHDGTDPTMELKVVKIILIREGLIMNLQYLCQRAARIGGIEGSNILDMLFQLRETTLNYLEALCLWRQASQQDNMPRAFLWENKNYTIKLIGDMDFLSQNPYVIDALNISPEQLKSNPLMLSNNLEDFNTWMDPQQRALQDVNGDTTSPDFESRLRLRFAERVLLQEQELYSNTDADIFVTNSSDAQFDDQDADCGYYLDNEADDHNPLFLDQRALDYDGNLQVGSTALEDDCAEFSDQPQSASDTVRSLYDQERRVKTTESSFPMSRTSTSSLGFSSAPSSAPDRRFHSSSGHDVFTGHWDHGLQESFPYFEQTDAAVQQSRRDASPMEPTQSHSPVIFSNAPQGDDQISVTRSIKSMDTISDLDATAVTRLTSPPRSLMLAGSVCVILFAPGDEIPTDVSWKAFIRLSKRLHLPSAMSELQPNEVAKFKIVAVQPILEVLFDETSMESVRQNSLPYEEFIAMNRLIAWVKQFTTFAIKAEVKAKSVSPFKEDITKKKMSTGMAKANNKKGNKVSLVPIRAPKPSATAVPSDMLDKVPVARKVAVPKVPTDLVPFHNEMVVVDKRSILLILFSTPAVASDLSTPSIVETTPLLIKAYDAVDSNESVLRVNIRELILLSAELCKKYSESAVQQLFAPLVPRWWCESVSKIVVIKSRTAQLRVSISNQAIESLIAANGSSNVQAPETKGHSRNSSTQKNNADSSQRQTGPTPVVRTTKASAPLPAKKTASSQLPKGSAAAATEAKPAKSVSKGIASKEVKSSPRVPVSEAPPCEASSPVVNSVAGPVGVADFKDNTEEEPLYDVDFEQSVDVGAHHEALVEPQETVLPDVLQKDAEQGPDSEYVIVQPCTEEVGPRDKDDWETEYDEEWVSNVKSSAPSAVVEPSSQPPVNPSVEEDEYVDDTEFQDAPSATNAILTTANSEAVTVMDVPLDSRPTTQPNDEYGDDGFDEPAEEHPVVHVMAEAPAIPTETADPHVFQESSHATESDDIHKFVTSGEPSIAVSDEMPIILPISMPANVRSSFESSLRRSASEGRSKFETEISFSVARDVEELPVAETTSVEQNGTTESLDRAIASDNGIPAEEVVADNNEHAELDHLDSNEEDQLYTSDIVDVGAAVTGNNDDAIAVSSTVEREEAKCEEGTEILTPDAPSTEPVVPESAPSSDPEPQPVLNKDDSFLSVMDEKSPREKFEEPLIKLENNPILDISDDELFNTDLSI